MGGSVMDLGGGVGWIISFYSLTDNSTVFLIVAQMMNVTEQDSKSHP